MRKLLTACMIALGLALLPSAVEARGHRGHGGCGNGYGGGCGYSCAVPVYQYEDRVVTVYRTEVRSEKVPTTITRCVVRYVDEPVKYTVLVPKWETVTRTITYCVAVPRVVERDVTCFRCVPVACVDPCTGCCYTTWQRESYVQRVSYTVYDSEQRSKDVQVQVCKHERQVREGTVRRCVTDHVKEDITVERRYCVSVPTEVTIRVPVCVGYSFGCGGFMPHAH
jgi:hypothetical protein